MEIKWLKRAVTTVIVLLIIILGFFTFFYVIVDESPPIVEHSDYYIDMPLNGGINYSVSIRYSSEGYFCVDKILHVDVNLTIFDDMFFEMVNNSNLMIMFQDSHASPISYFPDNRTPLGGGFSKEVHSKTITTECNISYYKSGEHICIISFITNEGKILYARNLPSTLEISSLDTAFQFRNENKTLLLAIASLIITVIGVLIGVLTLILPKLDTTTSTPIKNHKNNKPNKRIRK